MARETVLGIFQNPRSVATDPAPASVCQRPYVDSAVCTHQGCLVDTVANGTISCPCHGSAYSLTGDVTSGPATRPLASHQFSVVDGVVRV